MTNGEKALLAAVEAQRNFAMNQVAQMAQLLAEAGEREAALQKELEELKSPKEASTPKEES